MAKQEFARKPFNTFLYTWSVENDLSRQRPEELAKTCNALPGSNGEDFITTYVYDRVVDSKGIVHQYAYVACDYVE